MKKISSKLSMDIEDIFSFGYIESVRISCIDVPNFFSKVIFFNGCSIRCDDCHNCSLQERNEAKKMSLKDVLKMTESDLAEWVVFQGGEPFDQPMFLYKIIESISKNIFIYSGYSYSILQRKYPHILKHKNVKVIKCGKFVKAKRVYNKFLATTNQEIYIKKDHAFEKFNWLYDNDNEQFIVELKKFI